MVNFRTENRSCGSETINRACTEGVCRTDFDVMTSPCVISLSTDEAILVNVSATSVLGMGPPSLTRIGMYHIYAFLDT